jgi:prolyl oligopeptidase
MMTFAADKTSTANDNSSAASGKPSVIEGGNGITLPPPPPTEAKPVTETLHGVTVTDPYRWLEDAQSPATREWIAAQMKYTEQYFDQLKIRPEIVKRLTELVRVETYSIPVEAEGRYFFTKRLPDENQASIYMRKGLKGADERLVDATKLSADQNTNVSIADVSKDGSLLLYGIREGGADEESVHLLDVNSGKDSGEILPQRAIPRDQSDAGQAGHLLLEVSERGNRSLLPQDGRRGIGRQVGLRWLVQR